MNRMTGRAGCATGPRGRGRLRPAVRLIPAGAVLAASMAVTGTAAAAAAAPGTSLEHSVPAWATPGRMLGSAASAERVSVSVYLGWRDPEAVEALAQAVSDREARSTDAI